MGIELFKLKINNDKIYKPGGYSKMRAVTVVESQKINVVKHDSVLPGIIAKSKQRLIKELESNLTKTEMIYTFDFKESFSQSGTTTYLTVSLEAKILNSK